MSSDNYKKIKSHPHPGVYRFGESLGVGNPVSFIGNQTDSFGRLRASEAVNKLSIMQVNDEQPYLIDSLSGSDDAGYSYTKGLSATELSVSGSGSYIIRQTYERALYVPGNSLSIYHAFYGFGNEPNCIKRIGYFTSGHVEPYDETKDGLFFESDGVNGGYSFNIWRSGSLVEQTYQSDWNIDRMDGTGYTGLSMSFDRNHILQVDVQWLGLGRVRWGFDIDGVSHLVHESTFTNHPTHQGVYMTLPSQPLRWECRMIGDGIGSFSHSCSTAQLESSSEGISKSLSVNIGDSDLTLPLRGTRYLILQFRTLDGEESARILSSIFSFLSLTNDAFLYELFLNAVPSGTESWIPVPNGHSEADLGDGTRTVAVGNGQLVYSAYATSQTTELVDLDVDAIRFGTSIDGTRDRIVLCVTPMSTNMNLLYSISSKIVI